MESPMSCQSLASFNTKHLKSPAKKISFGQRFPKDELEIDVEIPNEGSDLCLGLTRGHA